MNASPHTESDAVGLPPPPRAGWRLARPARTWLLTAAVLLGIGVFKNINPLTLLGSVLLAVPLVNAPAAWWRTRGLTGRRRLPDFLVAGQPCPVRVSVGRAAGWSSGAVTVEDHGPPPARAWTWADGDAGVLQGSVVLPRRGRHFWGPLTAGSGHPFGLVWRHVVLAEGHEVTVLPPLGRVHRGLLRRHRRGADPRAERVRVPTLPHRTARAEFHGLREYRTGDSPHWIHWRTSARRGVLMAREYEDIPGEDLLVVLDAGGYSTGGEAEDEFEDAVSLTASLCWEWCQHKGDRLALGVAGDEPAALGGLTGAELALETLHALALAHPGESPVPAGWVERVAALAPDSAAVLLIGRGRSDLLEPLRRRLERPITFLDTGALDGLEFYTPPGRR